MQANLVSKYNVPGPRYTSYPTVPYWDSSTFNDKIWKESVIKSFDESNASEGISVYIHLPFCESLCTFCGCNKRITRNHSVEVPYLESVLHEWKLYATLFSSRPIIKELHFGGGTPTFFAAENLKKLIDGIFTLADKATEIAFSFEGHPNNTTQLHLQTLFECGFTRVSYGVQDYNAAVQKAIHRIQPFENVRNATDIAREIGYSSIGHDIIFGLPFQTKEHIISTINKTNELRPDRIAFYSYAHVPWIKGNGQRGFQDVDLPTFDEKREMYEIGKQLLESSGYVEIGMDHFALKSDALYTAMQRNKLHRNFMGYTESKTQLMIGLGVSSISDSWYSFAQNVKTVEEYQELVSKDSIPVYRGHVLNSEDLIIRKHILNLMCQLETSWHEPENRFAELPAVLLKLREMEPDGLLLFTHSGIQVTETGRPFVRNICMAFDVLLERSKPETQLFSMTI